jgi:hypothetical protein
LGETGQPAQRKLVLFWLIDPRHRIVSTADVDPQQDVISLEEALEHATG